MVNNILSLHRGRRLLGGVNNGIRPIIESPFKSERLVSLFLYDFYHCCFVYRLHVLGLLVCVGLGYFVRHPACLGLS